MDSTIAYDCIAIGRGCRGLSVFYQASLGTSMQDRQQCGPEKLGANYFLCRVKNPGRRLWGRLWLKTEGHLEKLACTCLVTL